MEINDVLNQLTQLVIKTFNNKKTKVIGIRDLEIMAKKININISIDEEIVSELCFKLREEGIIARPQGAGVFFHIRSLETNESLFKRRNK